MINAVLYSDQVIAPNTRVDARLVEMLAPRGNRIGFVASGHDPQSRFFLEKKAYYAPYGLDLAFACDLDHPADLQRLLACDAIHLSGGSTSAFLARLRRSGMLAILRDWVKQGGVLIGTSAGAILMTPTIAVDALFSGGRPEDARDAAALDLLPFEFFPHADKQASYMPDLLAYSATTPRPIVACNDGDGVVVENGTAWPVGEPLWLVDGSAAPMRPVALSDFAVSTRR